MAAVALLAFRCEQMHCPTSTSGTMQWGEIIENYWPHRLNTALRGPYWAAVAPKSRIGALVIVLHVIALIAVWGVLGLDSAGLQFQSVLKPSLLLT